MRALSKEIVSCRGRVVYNTKRTLARYVARVSAATCYLVRVLSDRFIPFGVVDDAVATVVERLACSVVVIGDGCARGCTFKTNPRR